MSGFEIVAIVVGVFFAMGIAVGILLVIVFPLLRSVLFERRNRHRYVNGGSWWKLPPCEDDDRPPRWPGR